MNSGIPGRQYTSPRQEKHEVENSRLKLLFEIISSPPEEYETTIGAFALHGNLQVVVKCDHLLITCYGDTLLNALFMSLGFIF